VSANLSFYRAFLLFYLFIFVCILCIVVDYLLSFGVINDDDDDDTEVIFIGDLLIASFFYVGNGMPSLSELIPYCIIATVVVVLVGAVLFKEA